MSDDKRPIIIDTDPGIDDAVALAIALFAEELDVKLITTVAGNVSLEKVTLNTLKLLTLYNKNVPVAKGAHKPIMRPVVDASGIHGETGMDGFDFPEPDTTLLLDKTAIEAMRDVIVESDEKITLIGLGPLTNIANFINVYPELLDGIEEVIIMGGAVGRGNSGVYAEFNFHVDPEAASILFNSGLKVTVATLEPGLKALVYPEDSAKIKEMHKIGEMFYALFSKYRGGSFNTGLKMYDSCAIAYLLAPEMFETVTTRVAVETKGEHTAGAFLVDLRNYLDVDTEATVTLDIDESKFKDWFLERISKCK